MTDGLKLRSSAPEQGHDHDDDHRGGGAALTGAAAATINRVPVLLLPGDIFARRNVAPVLQQLESASTQDISVNDCFKSVSRYWDRIQRPEQLLTSLPEAMRVLTSPADTGAVTSCWSIGNMGALQSVAIATQSRCVVLWRPDIRRGKANLQQLRLQSYRLGPCEQIR